MKGIRFVVDDTGERIAVIVDLEEHRDLWEDLYDALLADQRAHEARETIEDVRARLVKQGKLKPLA